MTAQRHLYPFCIALAGAVGTSSLSAAERFEGGHIGVEGDLGYSVTFETDFEAEGEEEEGTLDNGIEDFISGGSVFLGAGIQRAQFYYGLEGRYQFGGPDEDFLGDLSMELEDGHSISARLGTFLRDGSTMLYGSVGYASRGVTLDGGDVDDSEDQTGYRLGIGMEHRPVDPPILVRLEASRSDYGDEAYFGDISEIDIEIDDLIEYSAHLGIGYRF